MVIHVRATLEEMMLGTKPYDADIFDRWINGLRRDANGLQEMLIAKKTLDRMAEEAQEKVDDKEVAGATIFHRDPVTGAPIIYDYQIKGFFKGACGFLQRADDFNGGAPKSLKPPKKEKGAPKDPNDTGLDAYKKVIDGLVFPKPRLINLILPKGEKIGMLERPLRASTAQGEKICLARSETVPAGTTFDFSVLFLKKSLEPAIREWLEFGALHGVGQWRNAGYGRINCEILGVDKN